MTRRGFSLKKWERSVSPGNPVGGGRQKPHPSRQQIPRRLRGRHGQLHRSRPTKHNFLPHQTQLRQPNSNPAPLEHPHHRLHINSIAKSHKDHNFWASGKQILPVQPHDGDRRDLLLNSYQAARLVADGGFLSDLALVPVTIGPNDPPSVLSSGNPLATVAIPFPKQFTSSYLAARPSTDAMTEAPSH